MTSVLNALRCFDSQASERTSSPINAFDYWPAPDLSDVLLLMPSYHGPCPRAAAAVQCLVGSGVYPVTSFGYSDVAAHRNLVAGRARTLIRAKPCWRYVLWLDDDMLPTPSDIGCLRAIARAMREAIAVTAMYCKRADPRRLTLRPVLDTSGMPVIADCDVSQECHVHGTEVPLFELPRVVGGMGCLLVPVDTFLRHCALMGDVGIIRSSDAGEEPVPAVCSAGVRTSDGHAYWQSEDIGYTSGMAVHAAPLVVAHLSLVGLLPYSNARWL